MKALFILSLLVIATAMFSSCERKTIVETETVTVNDTLYLADSAVVTKFVLVRHAEKSSLGTDPVLTTAGQERAERLALTLKEIDLDRVYSTSYNRTMQTATPTADSQGISITAYGGFDHVDVINDVLDTEAGGNVLIVGHSNTTANFLNALTGTTSYPDLDEDAYDNLFIVNTQSKGNSKVLHLKY